MWFAPDHLQEREREIESCDGNEEGKQKRQRNGETGVCYDKSLTLVEEIGESTLMGGFGA